MSSSSPAGAGASAPAVFSLDSKKLRVIDIDGEPWFVAADVCTLLDLSNPSKSVSALDDDERSNLKLDRGGYLGIVSESGLYTLILRCRDAVKPGTMPHRVRRWVTAEVLPAIRKTGRYAGATHPTAVGAGAPDGDYLLSIRNGFMEFKVHEPQPIRPPDILDAIRADGGMAPGPLVDIASAVCEQLRATLTADRTPRARIEHAPRGNLSHSGATGVYSHRSKYLPWRAYVTHKGETWYLGAFPSVEEARQARSQALADVAAGNPPILKRQRLTS